MCNMDFNSDFDVCSDSGSDYESDISSDSNFEGLDTVDDSNYESFDEVENISSEVNADTGFDLEKLGAVDDTESETSDLADNLDLLETINDEEDMKSVESETETDLGSLEEIGTDDLSFNEDETAEKASLEELPLNELYETPDDSFPKVLTRDITPEIIESRNSDTEETLENYRDNLREYGVAEEEIEKFVEQEREKINNEYASLDNGDTTSDVYYQPMDWKEVADSLINGETEQFNTENASELQQGEELVQSEAEKAADYARSYGFDKAADYIERHYDGEEFVPGNPIPITTRNMALDGLESENGVSFERRTAELADGLSVEGVFPEFDSKHHVELGSSANDMSLHKQFSACKEDFQDHMYDSPEKLQDITFGAMERMDLPQGYTPEGYTWQHNPETGSFDLVSQDEHSVGHTGGNALWGRLDVEQ